MEGQEPSRLVRSYTTASRWQQRVVTHVTAISNGLWLGLMDRAALDEVDEIYYAAKTEYAEEAYNASGLKSWEAEMIDAHFPDSGRIVVTAAGGGRELLALLERGYDAIGYEPNKRLVTAGADLLEARGHAGRLRLVARDEFPPDAGPCDAVLVGWSSYMLIPGRARRIAFLRGARKRLPESAPILLSFFPRPAEARSFVTIARVANVARRLRNLPAVEVGDALSPNYTHHFTRDELASELEAGGFRLAVYSETPEGHAVARAV